MGEQAEEKKLQKPTKHICAGLLAHVDAGKTTLSEGMLYLSGSIRQLGRVDKGNAFLDTHAQERERGITIFSSQARLLVKDTEIILLDTPGHVDFSAEMERTLQVLDAAVLVVSGSDGVQGHTLTLWRLLGRYGIPVFLFINKMDQPDTDKEALLGALRKELSEYCIDFTDQESGEFFENIAVSDENALNEFLDTGRIRKEYIQKLAGERKIFPCFFGSALQLFGVEELLAGLNDYTLQKEYPREFGARVFKITRDERGNRLTHMKITGGRIRVREAISGGDSGGDQTDGTAPGKGAWEEKISQIRVYSGDRFETPGEAGAGEICTVTGLNYTCAGMGLGIEREKIFPELGPVISCSILPPEGYDPARLLPKLRQLEEEDPQLHIMWDEKNREIKAQLMGQVQTEVLRNLIRDRFGVSVEFGAGSIVYRETIADVVEGVGHFEPLRHYAEVHLLLEPGEPGSGLLISSDCSTDDLDLNWQRLVMTHLEEREHPGVLVGAPITDMRITLKAGRAHLKHTEGGDFRQATYRALRQGLMQAENVLLEPFYEFSLEVPENAVGRAMTDLDKMQADFILEQNEGVSVLRGMVPAAAMQEYQKEVASYTRGRGQLQLSLKGYFPCRSTQEVLERIEYDPDRDVENPSSSVFCAHGAGFVVEWDQVPSYMHLESCLKKENDSQEKMDGAGVHAGRKRDEHQRNEPRWIGQEEAEAILSRAAHANRKDVSEGKRGWNRTGRKGRSAKDGERTAPKEAARTRTYRPAPRKEEYLLVDGYNVIYAWEELKELAEENLDGARGRLLDILCNYQAIRGCSLIAVFDAYRLRGHATEALDYHNIHVVYTREAETADQYIERFAHENSRRYDVTVATSDGLEQMIIMGEGCRRMSSRELKEEVEHAASQAVSQFKSSHPGERLSMGQTLPLPTLPEQID